MGTPKFIGTIYFFSSLSLREVVVDAQRLVCSTVVIAFLLPSNLVVEIFLTLPLMHIVNSQTTDSCLLQTRLY